MNSQQNKVMSLQGMNWKKAKKGGGGEKYGESKVPSKPL